MKQREPVSQIVADNLARIMAHQKAKPVTVALAAGLSRTALLDILNGRSANPKLSTIASLAEALDVDLTDLFLTRDQLEAMEAADRQYEALPPEKKLLAASLVRLFRREGA